MPQIMTEPEDIASIMDTFRECRNPLSATSPTSCRGPYTSYILNVDESGLYIDQLIPNSGNYLIQPGQSVDILSTYKGINYLFRSEHISREVDDKGFPYHHISLPRQVQYSEKRTGYRIPIKRGEQATFHLSVTPGEPQLAVLENISDNGACLRLREMNPAVDTNSVVFCEFDLASYGPLCCKAIVRHYRQLPKTGETLLGVEFWQVPDLVLKDLEKALMTQQRRNIRSYVSA